MYTGRSRRGWVAYYRIIIIIIIIIILTCVCVCVYVQRPRLPGDYCIRRSPEAYAHRVRG